MRLRTDAILIAGVLACVFFAAGALTWSRGSARALPVHSSFARSELPSARPRQPSPIQLAQLTSPEPPVISNTPGSSAPAVIVNEAPSGESAAAAQVVPESATSQDSSLLSPLKWMADGLKSSTQASIPTDTTPIGASEPTETPTSVQIPLAGPDFDRLSLRSDNGLVSLVARDATLRDVVTLLAETHALNVITADPLSQTVTLTLDKIHFEDALDSILSISGYTWSINRNIMHITNLNNLSAAGPETQGLKTEVFTLDYSAAIDVQLAVQGLLSPLGSSSVITSSDSDNRRTREVLVVQDLPQYMRRVVEHIERVDVAPRQVLIEVHVLQVDLNDDNRHGVNFNYLLNEAGVGGVLRTRMSVRSQGLASGTSSQAFVFELGDGNLSSLLELLRNTTDAKTLASPRILALNGQRARIQVGEQLGFRVTTTTETSTTESVEFLDLGVVLEVTPRISKNGLVMMAIRPEVSSGQVNADTGLPEEKTTELTTNVVLRDNQGIVIGGLIRETDTDTQSKLPWLGDLKYLGRLFQHRETSKRRSEIVIALLPRIVPYDDQFVAEDMMNYERAMTPLLDAPLVKHSRPWEPQLEDAIANPQMFRLPRVVQMIARVRCAHCGNCCEGSCGGYDNGGTDGEMWDSTSRPYPHNYYNPTINSLTPSVPVDLDETASSAALAGSVPARTAFFPTRRPGAVRRLPQTEPTDKPIRFESLGSGTVLR